MLPGPSDAGSGTMMQRTGQWLALQEDAPGVRLKQTRDEIEQRRLAGAIGSDQAKDVACVDGEGDGVRHDDAAEALGDILQPEDFLRQCPGPAIR